MGKRMKYLMNNIVKTSSISKENIELDPTQN